MSGTLQKLEKNKTVKSLSIRPPLQTLAELAAAWHEQPRAQHFAEALMGFVGSQLSPHTRLSYDYSIRQFWRWYSQRTGKCPVPSEITRTEATAYAAWLRKQGDEAIELQLRGRGETLGLAIYQVIRANPNSHIDDIRQHLAKQGIIIDANAESIDKLDHKLAYMVQTHLLNRQPTYEEACKQDEEAGGEVGIDYRPDPGVYRYSAPPPGKLSAATVWARLKVLSSFWSYLIDTGENIQGGREPLLVHNIWQKLATKARKAATRQQKAMRAIKTPSLELFEKLLATTFQHSHTDPSAAAAKVVHEGKIPTGTGTARIYDLRDRAWLIMVLFTGLRAEEVSSIRHRDISDGLLMFTGKGGKTRLLKVPEPVLTALGEFHRRLLALAEKARQDSRAAPRTRLLDHPDAPLLPGLKHWGKNANHRDIKPEEIRGLGKSGVSGMLRRRARAIGIKPGSTEWKQLGAHGIRHLAAHYALDRGVPLPIIKEVLGHESLATTGIYVEQHDTEKITLWP